MDIEEAWALEEADHVMKAAWATFTAFHFTALSRCCEHSEAASPFEYKDRLRSVKYEEMQLLI